MADEFPNLILPQLSTLSKQVPDGDEWFHETKYDGYRLLCRKDGNRIDFYSRRGSSWSGRYPLIEESIAQLKADQVWLDGELVMMLEKGRSCFGTLREALARGDQACLAYYVFDLLYLNGKNVCKEALAARKEMLLDVIGTGEENLKYVEYKRGHGPEFLGSACEKRLEGVMSKRADSIYRPGQRTTDWIKVKCSEYKEVRHVKWEWWEK